MSEMNMNNYPAYEGMKKTTTKYDTKQKHKAGSEHISNLLIFEFIANKIKILAVRSDLDFSLQFRAIVCNDHVIKKTKSAQISR